MSKQFFKKLEKYIPNLNEYLNAGTPDTNRLEEETGYHLPDSFKNLYSLHNGDRDYFGLFFGLQWLSIDGILQHWKNNKKYHDELFSSNLISFEKGKIKEEYFHPDWLPIAYDGGGNYIGIDYSPGPNGILGQIINFGRDEEELFVISNSFEELLQLLIQQFEHGNCRVVDEDELHVAWKDDGHFFDELKTLFTENSGEEIQLDANWQQAIGNQRNLQKVTKLNLLNSGITDLSPLVQFPQLRELIASGLQITAFRPISNLVELKKLYLAKTPFSDLSVLRPLRELQELSVGNTQVMDLSVLPELPSLRKVSLKNLKLKDLIPLTKCIKLKTLDLSGVQTDSFSEIEKLTNLISLDLSDIPLNDLNVLHGMTKLRELTFEPPVNGNYEVFKNLKNIEYITCPFPAFMEARNLLNRKIHFTICGGMNEAEKQLYRDYVWG